MLQKCLTGTNNEELVCLVDNLRIREKPDIKSAILGKMMKNETAQIIAIESGAAGTVKDFWYKITDKNNLIGWVFGDYIGYPFKKRDDNSLIYVKNGELEEKANEFGRTRGAILYVNSDDRVVNHINLEGSVPGYSRGMHILSIENPDWDKKENDGKGFTKYFNFFRAKRIVCSEKNIFGSNLIGAAGSHLEAWVDGVGYNYSDHSIRWISINGMELKEVFAEKIYATFFNGDRGDRVIHLRQNDKIIRIENGLPYMISNSDFNLIHTSLTTLESQRLQYYYGKYPYELYKYDTSELNKLFNFKPGFQWSYDIAGYCRDRKVHESDLEYIKQNMKHPYYYSKEIYQKLTEIFSTIDDYPYVLHENITCPYLPIFTPDETEEARRLLKKAGYTWDEGAVTVYKWNGTNYEYDKYYKSVADYEKDNGK